MVAMKTVFFVAEPRHATSVLATIAVVVSVAKILICGIFWPIIDNLITSERLEDVSEDTKQGALALVNNHMLLIVGILLLDMSINIMFLVGTIKRRRMLMLPWIIIYGLNLLVASVCICISVVIFLTQPIAIFFGILCVVLIYGFAIYCWIVVIAAFKQIGREHHGESRYTHTQFYNPLASTNTLPQPHTQPQPQPQMEGKEHEAYNPMTFINLEAKPVVH